MSWVACRLRRPGAVRLYCFPHSGATAGEYLRWSDHLPELEVLGVQLPGRGARWEDPPSVRMEDVVGGMLRDVRFDGPFVFFGHSLGAWIAFEAARALGRAGPHAVIVSGAPDPYAPRRVSSISALPDDALIDAIADHYGRRDDGLDDPELRELVLPGLRGDLAIADAYRPSAGAPLRCGIVALGGTEDRVSPDDLAQWRQRTVGSFAMHTFPGDHFYLREQRDAVLEVIAATALHGGT